MQSIDEIEDAAYGCVLGEAAEWENAHSDDYEEEEEENENAN